MDGENRVSAQAADQYFALYRRKVLSLDAWRRLLAGKTSYKTLVKVLMKKSRRAAQNRPTLFNQRLIRALGNIPAAQKLLWIVYGDRDPEYSDFQHFRMEHVPAQALTEIFANTSHGFLTEESLSKLLSSVDAFARLLTVRASADAMAISVVN